MKKNAEDRKQLLAKIRTINNREKSLLDELKEIALNREDLFDHLKDVLDDDEDYSFDFLANARRLKSPEAIEKYLEEIGQSAKVSDITEGIRQMGLIDQTEDSVRSTLVRHHAKKHRFRRVDKNTYDLIDRKKEKN